MLSSPGALGVLHAGGCVVMASNPEPLNCFSLIHRHAVTMVALVPSAVTLWLQVAPDHLDELRTLQLVQVGGASFAESLARQVPDVLNCRLQQVFGMAEGLVNYTRLDDPDEQIFTTQGRAISPDDEIKIVNEDGLPVRDGEPGMLATRGPYTFCGYYRSPEHNAEVFDKDGYYYSGDLVVRTPHGNLHERMRNWNRDQLIIGGIYAHIGCMVTAVDAFMSDVQPFLVADAVADFSLEDHRFALKYTATRCGHVLDTESLVVSGAAKVTRQWLYEWAIKLVEDDSDLDPDENLIVYGLDSLRIMQLSSEFKKRGVTISFEELGRNPTLSAWWSLVVSRQRAV